MSTPEPSATPIDDLDIVPAGVDPVRHAQLRDLVRVLDSSIRVPGTGVRFGWDAVMGLVPGVGDATSLVFSGVVILQAVRLGARGWTLTNMLLRSLVDAVVGSIPIAGTIFDVVHRANERNLRLLNEHMEDPKAARDRSRSTVVSSLVGVIVVVAVWVVALVAVTTWLVSAIF